MQAYLKQHAWPRADVYVQWIQFENKGLEPITLVATNRYDATNEARRNVNSTVIFVEEYALTEPQDARQYEQRAYYDSEGVWREVRRT